MTEIVLPNGTGTTLVDDIDLPLVTEKRWWLTHHGYVAGHSRHPDGRFTKIMLHRVIMQAGPGMQVDHINHNRADNRRSNLRLCSKMQNHHNMLKHRPGTSRFKGVSWAADRGKWIVVFKPPNAPIKNVGRFLDERDAARKYDEMARRYFGDFACTNESLGLLCP